ncbi:DUF551 domain-containing protein [Pasteurella caecimuris]|uniref:DUF551 domain-containing protein n=1 Tax=Rodentibacter caecimuris TaxID=1796644 RepID=UPI0021503EB6|nr:DUF551 domain-containing protein [Pasteurella caecimuris]MCR1838505.1 DUF551 domain-containing protein [Pasteurella caecimuris]MCU0108125.1 DUF551 domain-containing protein [Pasteurella caecimuris]
MSENNNGWIKCSEKLPAIFNHKGVMRSDVVIGFGKEESDDATTYIFVYLVGGNRFYSENGECYKITHWQPLPAPPQE